MRRVEITFLVCGSMICHLVFRTDKALMIIEVTKQSILHHILLEERVLQITFVGYIDGLATICISFYYINKFCLLQEFIAEFNFSLSSIEI